MLDLKKFTKFNQLADKIEMLEAGLNTGIKPSPAYMLQIEKAQNQYDKLHEELRGQLDLPVNLGDYVHNLIQYLQARDPDGGKWYYQYNQLADKTIESEHFYGVHTYHEYKYQVVILNGGKEIPVCEINRELNYANKKTEINMLYDKMFAPFSLRLDETSDEFDDETCRDLKKIYFKTYIMGKLVDSGQKKSLIRAEIEKLKTQYREEDKNYRKLERQLDNLEFEQINIKK